ncbi:MAG: hypothetical protein D6680_09125 [Cyanobacteria bacterium J007]|nr:MAG: hypothetical protein D6680_09125 [Cyanobacteria bacterium J007]
MNLFNLEKTSSLPRAIEVTFAPSKPRDRPRKTPVLNSSGKALQPLESLDLVNDLEPMTQVM